MFELIFAILWALSCANHNPAPSNNHGGGQVTTMDDTGGETGHIPPDPPTHP
jgi:hypothetical protein